MSMNKKCLRATKLSDDLLIQKLGYKNIKYKHSAS